MPAFSGKHYYTVDEKGRLIIPAPFREIFSTHYSSRLYITNAAFDRCLHIYPYEEWSRLEEKVRALPKMLEDVRIFMRRVVASAQECSLDKQGRLLIPAAHREDAGIKGDVVIVGQIEKIELWDRKEWESVIDLSNIDRKTVEERLAAYGL
ncbi:MAG TPA: division/cell wall cluster transcriptional repressor MraZ [Thermodesulfovibrionales bacterium]|nr:division/cell wall cluster transcriptional repressor MraZ [Thermodesulfovibrionales bacterium]